MKEHHIFINGLIGEGVADLGQVWIAPKNVQDQINAAGKADTLVVHIHSRGGNVNDGFAIHDMLKNSGKKIVTIIEGLCASIATVIALAGEERKMTRNSDFMIHNPMLPPESVGGDADELQAFATEVKRIEDKIIDFYHKATGIAKDVLDELMKVETSMGAEKAENLKFITEIIEPEVKAVALLDISSKSKKSDMNKKEITALSTKLDGMIDFVKKHLGIKNEDTTNRVLTLADGNKIKTDTQDELASGQGVVWDETGQVVADGDWTMKDGGVIVVAGGKITEVKAAEGDGGEGDDNAETKALKAKIAELEAKVNGDGGEGDKKDPAIEALNKKVEFLSKHITTNFVPEEEQTQMKKHDEMVKNARTTGMADRRSEYPANKQEDK